MDYEWNTYKHMVVTSDQTWDPHGLVMPGGETDDTVMEDNACVIQQMKSNQQHHEQYKSNCIAITIDGNIKQLLYKCMIKSVWVTKLQQIARFYSTARHSMHTMELVEQIIGVGIGTVQDIVATSIQKGIWHSVMPLN